MQSETKDASIGNFDYECPDAKFIVSKIPAEGIGGSLRYGAVSSLLLGLGTDRVVLFLDSTPWPAASCDRHDLQCFFMPVSPCVITEVELANAPMLSNKEVAHMRRTGVVDDKYKNERVIRVFSSAIQNGGLQPPTVKRAIMDTIRSMYNATTVQWKEDDESAMDDMMKNVEKSMGRWTVDHAAALYVMRPNDFYQKKIKDRMDKLFPNDFNPERAIGLPIRGELLGLCKLFGFALLTFTSSFRLQPQTGVEKKVALLLTST